MDLVPWSVSKPYSAIQEVTYWGGGRGIASLCKGMSCDSKWWLWKEPLGLPCWVAWLIIWKTALPEAYQGQSEPFGTGKVFSEMG